MRIRTIKPEFFKHDGLFELERETGLPIRIAYAGIWCVCDREGRFKWRPRQLGVEILPYDGIDFSRVLHALTTRGFLVRYRVGNEWFGAVPSWKRHQIINNKERSSEIPDVSAAEEVDACPTRAPRVDHACHKEGKGKEGNGSLSIGGDGANTVLPIEVEHVNPPVDPQWPTRIAAIHGWYSTQMGGTPIRLDGNLEHSWFDWFKAGFCEDQFKSVFAYLRKQIDEGKRNHGALKLSNLLQGDRFSEDLSLAEKFKHATNQRTNRPSADRNAGTANAGRAASYGSANSKVIR